MSPNCCSGSTNRIRRLSVALAAAALFAWPGAAPAAPGQHIATVVGPEAPTPGFFGTSVALQGSMVGVGETAWLPAGRTYTFAYEKKTSTLNLLTTLDSPAGTAFGSNVSFRKKTLLSGAPNTYPVNPSGTGGAVAISTARKTLGTILALFTVENLNDNAELGAAVRGVGKNILIGAPRADVSATTAAGKAFLLDASVRTLVAELRSPEPRENARFGTSVHNAGNRLIVGAPGDGTTTASGAVYVFRKRGKVYVHEMTIQNPQPQENARFGHSVAGLGPRILIGAPGAEASTHPASGRAYIFRSKPARDGNPIPLVELTNPEPGTMFGFGTSVVLVNGKVAAIGAPGTDRGGAAGAGTVHLFQTRDGATLPSLPHLDAPTASTNGKFGQSASGGGKLFVVGEPGFQSNRGAIHLFSLR